MRKKSLIIAVIFTIIDQLIKLLINHIFLVGEKRILINNFWYLTKVYNTGAAWSTLNGNRFLLIIIALCSFVILYLYQARFAQKKRTMLGYALIYGGLFGNLIDRCYLGYVIDYIGIYIGKYPFPIFNFADMCLVFGFILVIYAIFKGDDKDEIKKSN